jgi:hypothetical protein
MIASHHLPGVSVASRAEADVPLREYAGRKAVEIVRYADPAAWLVAAAVCRGWDAVHDRPSADEVGVITVGSGGPTEAMRAVADGTRAGQASAMRFAAASPCTLTGVTCIAGGFRGPTLNVTMPPATGVRIALLVAAAWLRSGVKAVAVAAQGRRIARCVVLVPTDGGTPAGEVADWLAGAELGVD